MFIRHLKTIQAGKGCPNKMKTQEWNQLCTGGVLYDILDFRSNVELFGFTPPSLDCLGGIGGLTEIAKLIAATKKPPPIQYSSVGN